MKDSTAVIVNLTEQTWMLHRGYGTFSVHGTTHATASGEAARGGSAHGEKPCSYGSAAGRTESVANPHPYTLTRVSGRNAQMDLGDKRSIDVPISAMEVAQDLCREINSDGGEDSFFGVFAAAGDEPTGEELADARARLEAFYRRLVEAADREWERSHSYLFINDVERRAAQYLGLEKEWYYQVRETAECPACGEKVKPGVAVCKTCGAILDREKAASLGLGLAAFAVPAASIEVTGAATPSAAAQPLASPSKAQPTSSRR